VACEKKMLGPSQSVATKLMPTIRFAMRAAVTAGK